MNVNDAMCDHAAIIIPLAFGIITVLAVLLYREIITRRREGEDWRHRVEEKLDMALNEHAACQKTLPEKYASIQAIHELFMKFDKLADKLTEFPHKYRTKEEANKDWMSLNTLLCKIETQQKERHDQLWAKLDNQTKLFMQEKEFININLLKLSDRMTTMENHGDKI